MKVKYKNILVLQNFNEAVGKLNFSTEDFAVIGRLSKLSKKMNSKVEELQELIEDLRLDHCMKDGQKIVRENGQLQWTVDGERAFRKAYKALLEKEVELDDFTQINYADIMSLLPKGQVAEWEEVKENLGEFFVYIP
jgi:hypothetical protein